MQALNDQWEYLYRLLAEQAARFLADTATQLPPDMSTDHTLTWHIQAAAEDVCHTHGLALDRHAGHIAELMMQAYAAALPVNEIPTETDPTDPVPSGEGAAAIHRRRCLDMMGRAPRPLVTGWLRYVAASFAHL